MKRKVLIVDDEVAYTQVIKLTLEAKENYEVRVENNPRLAGLTARRFSPDIVILDIVMPEFDGGEVHAQFKADPVLKNIPIVYLTAIVRQNELDEHNGVIGGSFYIAKPVSADDLVCAIEEHARH